MKTDELMIIYTIIIMFTALVIPRLSKNTLSILNHFFIKILLLSIIIYTSMYKSLQVISILIIIFFVSIVYHYNKFKIIYSFKKYNKLQ
jgi:hypothetical protein